MNNKAKFFLKSLNYTITANFFVLGISIILNLLIPKFLGVKNYGYWQLYVFYSSYVGFFHFGWIDGIYLKIGGDEYDDLDKKSLGTQLYYLFLFELSLSVILTNIALFMVTDSNKKIILIATALILVIANLKNFVLYILQSTNRIKEYAQLSKNDRYLYLVVSLCYLSLGGKNPFILIYLDVFSKLIVTLWGLTRIKDMVNIKRDSFLSILSEIKDNIRVGSNLMIGNIASMLILGISRFFVERHWTIETFGKLSFALSISNMFMLFISAISVVLYPLLRRTDPEKLSELYLNVRIIFVTFTLILLLFFQPVKFALQWWLPEYKSSLLFMGLLFPMIVYEGRISLLVNTYLKTIREEKIILISNLITLGISTVFAYISVFVLNNLKLTVLSILFSLGFRSILAESLLAKKLDISVSKNIVVETLLILVFICSNLFLNNQKGFIVYLIFIIIYILLYKNEIKKGICYFKNILFVGK